MPVWGSVPSCDSQLQARHDPSQAASPHPELAAAVDVVQSHPVPRPHGMVFIAGQDHAADWPWLGGQPNWQADAQVLAAYAGDCAGLGAIARPSRIFARDWAQARHSRAAAWLCGRCLLPPSEQSDRAFVAAQRL